MHCSTLRIKSSASTFSISDSFVILFCEIWKNQKVSTDEKAIIFEIRVQLADQTEIHIARLA